MKRRILLTIMVAALALPATAGLFSAKGDNVEVKRDTVRKVRDEILAKLYAAHPEAREKIEKKLSAVQAGQFLQIENQIGLFIDVTIASEMPRVGEKGK